MSNVCIGAVLMKNRQPIGYISKKNRFKVADVIDISERIICHYRSSVQVKAVSNCPNVTNPNTLLQHERIDATINSDTGVATICLQVVGV